VPRPAETVCAVVVTYDRRDLLIACLGALRAQTRAVDRIVVVDNASSDGTPELLRAEHPDVDLVALDANRGSSGGFEAGMRHAHAIGFDWLWLMDDDTIATPTALEELLAAPARLDGAAPAPALLTSKVVWSDGTLHPMTAPGPDRTRWDGVAAAAAQRLLALRSTTFVSLLVSRAAVDAHGFPDPRFFIWSDDIEYTGRILRRDAGYLVTASVVEHRTKTAHSAVTDAGPRFYFHIRNTLYMIRGASWDAGEKLGLGLVVVTTSWQFLRRNRFARESLGVVARGLRDGLRG
jgi:GT2 family glycosyltransferase